jgi:hypothetical protein
MVFELVKLLLILLSDSSSIVLRDCFVFLQSLTVGNFYAGEGIDRTGVPTKLVTMNCSLQINVHNPSTMFGIHVSSTSIQILFSQIAIANGQVAASTFSTRISVLQFPLPY